MLRGRGRKHRENTEWGGGRREREVGRGERENKRARDVAHQCTIYSLKSCDLWCRVAFPVSEAGSHRRDLPMCVITQVPNQLHMEHISESMLISWGMWKPATLRSFGQGIITLGQQLVIYNFLVSLASCLVCQENIITPTTRILLFIFTFLLPAQFHTGPIMWPLTDRLTGAGACQLNKYLNEIQSASPLKWDAASNLLSTTGGILRPLQLGVITWSL